MLAIFRKIFFVEQHRDINIIFWSLLGPFFIVLTLFLSSFYNVNRDLFLYAFIGFGCCCFKKLKSLIITLFCYFFMLCIKHLQIPQNIWQLGVEISLALGFVISHYSVNKAKEVFSIIDINLDKLNTTISNLKENNSKEKDFFQRQDRGLKKEIEDINLQLEEKKMEISSFKQSIEQLRENHYHQNQHIEKFQNTLEEKEEFINSLKTEITDLTNLRDDNCEINKKLLHCNNLYKQLKLQFDEKSNELSKARKEHFLTSEKLNALIKETEHMSLEQSEREKKLYHQLELCEKKVTLLEEENSSLEQIITNLSTIK